MDRMAGPSSCDVSQDVAEVERLAGSSGGGGQGRIGVVPHGQRCRGRLREIGRIRIADLGGGLSENDTPAPSIQRRPRKAADARPNRVGLRTLNRSGHYG